MSGHAQTVVTTGASSGFGEGAVRAFAARLDRVWDTMRDTCGRNADKKAALEACSPAISIIETDVTSDTSVVRAFAAIHNAESVNILIKNAGIMYFGMTEAYSVAQAREQMETNYYGAIHTMQAVLPAMRAAGSGLIINTSSIAARVSVPFFGTTWGVDEVNAFTQPRQDALLKEMQLDGVLGGADV